MTLKIKRNFNLHAMVYTRKFECVEEEQSKNNSMKMISNRDDKTTGRDGSLMEKAFNMETWHLCFCVSALFSHRRSMKRPTRLSSQRSPLPYSSVRSQILFKVPTTLCLPGSFWLENLVILTLKSAHAWQNVDRMPQGIGSKQDFALLVFEDTFLSLCTQEKKKINRALFQRKTAPNQRSWVEYKGLMIWDPVPVIGRLLIFLCLGLSSA